MVWATYIFVHVNIGKIARGAKKAKMGGGQREGKKCTGGIAPFAP